jgi:hypothetical protein
MRYFAMPARAAWLKYFITKPAEAHSFLSRKTRAGKTETPQLWQSLGTAVW